MSSPPFLAMTRFFLARLGRFLPLLLVLWGINMPLGRSQDSSNAISVRSDVQEANAISGVITARGNVQVNYPARKIQATAQQLQYFSKERRIVLTGNVYVLQDGNSMRAETMTYLVDEGRFVATPGQKKQVEAIYIIPPEATTGGGKTIAPGLPTLPPLKP